MWLPIIGVLMGIILGMMLPIHVPTAYSSYMSIAVLAALDSVFGGIRASLEKKFEIDVFISGFFGNAFLAAGLAYIGDRLDIPIYLAAIFAFGSRLFQNFAMLRRYFLNHLKRRNNRVEESLEENRTVDESLEENTTVDERLDHENK